MARCGCASDQCSCTVVAGANVDVQGTGSRVNPYVISAATEVIFEGGGGGASRITGEIVAYGGTSAPAGWLMCNGAAISRAVYSDLYAVMGTSYGAGDGSTTFNLPDISDRLPMGASGDHPRGTSGGSAEVTLETANLPAHTHAIDHDHAVFTTGSGGAHQHGWALYRSNSDGGNNTVKRDASGTDTPIAADGSHTHNVNVPAYTGASGSTGSGDAVDTTPPYVAVNYIVKV